MDPVVHFELPAENTDRIAAFYRSVFGWGIQRTGEGFGGYVHATTTPADKRGRPKTPGAINGGFFPKKADFPAQFPSVVIGVGDIKKAMAKVAQAGGKVLGEPMEIPGAGPYVSFLDTEGNRLSMLQPMMRSAAPRAKKKAKPASKKKMKAKPAKKAGKR